MKLSFLVICCCLLLCIANSAQATQLEPSIIEIDLIGGDTKNITINVTGEETIYLEHEILPDSEGINITYPLIVNPLETKSFNMTISAAVHIAPGNYTIILKYYYYEEVPDDEGGGGNPPGFTPVDPVDYPDDDDQEPEPEPDDDEKPQPSPEPDGSLLNVCILTFICLIIVVIMVLYIIISKKNKRGKMAEKPGSEKNEQTKNNK